MPDLYEKYPYRLAAILREINTEPDYKSREEQLESLITLLPPDNKYIGMIRKDFGWRSGFEAWKEALRGREGALPELEGQELAHFTRWQNERVAEMQQAIKDRYADRMIMAKDKVQRARIETEMDAELDKAQEVPATERISEYRRRQAQIARANTLASNPLLIQ
jgi:hypothetical protein